MIRRENHVDIHSKSNSEEKCSALIKYQSYTSTWASKVSVSILLINNSEARIDWTQSMQRDPCNRKLAALIWVMMAL